MKSDVALAPTTTLAQLGIMSESLLFLEVREARPSPPRAGRSGGQRGAGREARPSPPRDDRGNRRPAFPSPRRTPRPRSGGGGLLLDGSGKANGRAAHREEWQDVVVLGGGEGDALYGEGGGMEGGGCYGDGGGYGDGGCYGDGGEYRDEEERGAFGAFDVADNDASLLRQAATTSHNREGDMRTTFPYDDRVTEEGLTSGGGGVDGIDYAGVACLRVAPPPDPAPLLPTYCTNIPEFKCTSIARPLQLSASLDHLQSVFDTTLSDQFF